MVNYFMQRILASTPQTIECESWARLPKTLNASGKAIAGGMRMLRMWWPKQDQPLALMVVVHGLGDHSGRYAPLAEELNRHRIGVLSMDLPGHGLSPGWRGCIHSYDGLLLEIASLVQLAGCQQQLHERATNTEWPTDQPMDFQQWLSASASQAHDFTGCICFTTSQAASLHRLHSCIGFAGGSNLGWPVCLYGHSMGGNLVLNASMRGLAKPDREIASSPMLRAVHPPAPMVIRLEREPSKACCLMRD